MILGTVTGKIWATRKLKELPSGALLEIEVIKDGETTEHMVAFDPLGAGRDERVLVTLGSVAKGWFKSHETSNVVIDALVIGIVDEKIEN